MGMAGSQRCGSVPESRARVPRGVCHHPLQSACVPRGCASISRDCASFPRTVPGPGGGVCWCPRGGASVPRGCASVARKSASFPRAVPGPQQGAGVPGVSCVVVVSPALALGCAAVCRCPRGCARSPGDAGVPRRVLVFQGCVVVTRARTRVPSSVPASPGLCQVLGRAGNRDSTGGSRCSRGTESPSGGPRCYQGARGAIRDRQPRGPACAPGRLEWGQWGCGGASQPRCWCSNSAAAVKVTVTPGGPGLVQVGEGCRTGVSRHGRACRCACL